MLAGLLPALQTTRPDLQDSLKDGGRTTAGPARRRLRAGLVVSEVALSLVLLAGAGLMIRTLVLLLDVSPGFQARGVLSFSVDLPRQRYPTDARGRPKDERVAQFFATLLERAASLPGITSAGGVSQLALTGADSRSGVTIEGREPRNDEPTRMHHRVVMPGYFETLGIPLLAGRLPNAADTRTSPPVLVVNQAAARRYWEGARAVGRRVQINGTDDWREVIGVVGDVKHWGLDSDARPEMYVPFAQEQSTYMTLVFRTTGDTLSQLAPLRDVLRKLDPDLPLGAPRSLEQVVSQSVASRRFFLDLMRAFAALALLLAVVGIYAVIACNVAQRSHEFGVRMSLGAHTGDIRRLVLGEGLRIAGLGVVVGVAGALALGRFIREQLFGVTSQDPVTLLAVSLLLLASALLACYVPAYRATRVDPAIALRCE
jgi:putative ABC transport system permease protein